MIHPLILGAIVCLTNFGMHAVMTGLIVVATRHIAKATDDLHVFAGVSALLLVTVSVLMVTHVAEIWVWSGAYRVAGIDTSPVSAFEFAFENYTAVGYGDAVAKDHWRVIGPVTALNGLLLIGWSVAVIFEVVRMAEVQIGRRPRAG